MFCQFGDAFGRLAVFQIGVAAQCAQPGAGGVHQHAVGFTDEAFEARVGFTADALRADVGEAGAHHARLEFGQPLFGHVEGVEAAAVVHGGAQGEGFAACACAEIDDNFAAPCAGEAGEQLAALVLHFDGAF